MYLVDIDTIVAKCYSLVNQYYYDKYYPNREPIHIIGNGWGAYYCAKGLDKTKFQPVIIAPNERVVNTPNLAKLVFEPHLDPEFRNPHAKLILDTVIEIDSENNKIKTQSNGDIQYSKLIFAIGSEVNDFGIKGVQDHTLKLKTIENALELRANILKELANPEHPLEKIFVIGSGITGVELSSFLSDYPIQVQVIEGLPSILPGFDKGTQEAALNYFKEKNIKLDVSCFVKSIESKKIIASNKEFDSHNSLIVWTGGVRFTGYNHSKLFQQINAISPIKPRGLDVNEDFSIGKFSNIFCIGDMVANKGPPTAQNARNQACWVANYLNYGLNEKWKQENKYQITSQGKLLHLNDKLYLESPYYSGFVPNFLSYFIDLFNRYK